MSERTKLTEFWIQHGTDLRDEKRRAASMELLRKCQAAGVTHMALGEPSMHLWDEVDAAWRSRIDDFRDSAARTGVSLMPSIFPIGYGGRFLAHDVNLAAGIPARNVAFVVKGREALPDPAAVPRLLDSGFHKAKAGRFAQWKMDYPGRFSFVDTKVKHTGKSSLRISAKGPLPEEAKGFVRVRQQLAVKPFSYYRLSLWVKTQDVKTEREDYVMIMSQGGKRRHTYFNMPIQPTQEWTRHECVLNTLEADSVELSVGTSEFKGGTVWFDDLEITPAGLLNVVQRKLTPLEVKSADGKTVYKEGKDFERVRESGLTEKTLGEIDRPGAAMRLTGRSRIRNRQRLLVSYFHSMRIYKDQIVLSFEEPKLYELMDRQLEHVAKLWKPRGYFMTADEIRVAGWELQPDGETLSCAELLGRYMRRSIEIIRKYDPDAQLYIWSDMFTPFHNGRPFEEAGFYYLCSGTFYGCWKDLPADVRIANWYSPARMTPVWFEARGHKQILCGYYDNPNLKANISHWMEVTRGVDGVIGIMYTNWSTGHELMGEFFRLAREYPDWAAGGAEGPSGVKER